MLFVGDDWASDHHDVEVQNTAGAVLATVRLPEGVAGLAKLHALIAEHLTDRPQTGQDHGGDPQAGDPQAGDPQAGQVMICIEHDRGPWVAALIAAGYRVLVINPRQTDRARDRLRVSGAKSDPGDAHVLADLARTDHHQLRTVAGDSDLVTGLGYLARAHQSMIWERTRHVLRLRATLREYFPAALDAFGGDLDAPEALELLGRAPDPQRAAALSLAKITAALTRARRRDVAGRAAAIAAALRAPGLARDPEFTAACAVVTGSLISVILALQAQVVVMGKQVEADFGRHPDAGIYRSQPGIAAILGARVAGEFGDDPDRYATAKARKNYAGTSPLTITSGKRRAVQSRHVRNPRLIDALMRQAQAALRASPGARAYYDAQRGRGVEHAAALRQLANRLVGILHGCLKHRTLYDEDTAWGHHTAAAAA